MNLATLVEPHPAELRALVDDDGPQTFGALREAAARRRGWLRQAGVGPGDRVVIATPSDRLFVETYLAVVGMGAVAVPLNRRAPAAELLAEAGAVEPALAVVEGLRDPDAGRQLAALTTVVGDAEGAETDTDAMTTAR